MIDNILLLSRDLLSSENLLEHLKCGNEEISRWTGEETVATGEGGGVGSVPTGGGRAYGWAQQLGGIQCMPQLDSARDTLAPPSALPSASSSAAPAEPFGFLEAWFTALCRRLESRMSLNAEVRSHTYSHPISFLIQNVLLRLSLFGVNWLLDY